MVSLQLEEHVPEAVGNILLLNARGDSTAFYTLMGDAPVIFVILRHFGCIGCSEHVTAWKARLAEFHRLGIKVVMIGNGPVKFLESFNDRYALKDEPVAVYTDPTLAIHKALSMQRSLWATFGARALRNVLRAFGRGHMQTSLEGDWLQQGGLFVVGPEKHVHFIHRERAIGDFLDVSDVFETVLPLIDVEEKVVL